jgi:hypothetical protein
VTCRVRAAAAVLVGVLAALVPAVSSGAATPNHWSIGVYKGSMRLDYVHAHEQWLGRSVETVMEFLPYDSWASFEQPTTQLQAWAGSPYDVVFTTPMIPKTGATLAAGASGAYDEHWRTFARTMVAGGRPDAIIRLGHEMNHTWYPWSAANGHEADFAAYFRRIVTVLRSVPGTDFRFTWNVLSGVGTADVAAAYPGDAYVDNIGLDIYDDVYNVVDFEQRWARLRSQPYGIDWLASFAASHGKHMSFDEWGLITSTNSTARSPLTNSGDDVVYINRMIDFFESHDVAYASYFDVDTAFGATNSRISGSLSPYPNASAAYRSRVLATGTTSGSTTTSTTSTTRPSTTTTTRPPATTTSTTRGRSSGGGGGGGTRPATTTTVPVRSASLPTSDEFAGTSLTGRWTYANPRSDSHAWVKNGDLTLIAVAGATHDVTTTADHSVRTTQAATGSFGLDVRFTSTPKVEGTWQGVTATTGTKTLRLALGYYNGALHLVGDVLSASGRTKLTEVTVPKTATAWVLRVERRASTWSLTWAKDGGAFAKPVTTTMSGTVRAVGPAVGNVAMPGKAPQRIDAWVSYARFRTVA